MKCSEYLWKYVELQRLLKGESPERVQGEMRTILGQEKIVSEVLYGRRGQRPGLGECLDPFSADGRFGLGAAYNFRGDIGLYTLDDAGFEGRPV